MKDSSKKIYISGEALVPILMKIPYQIIGVELGVSQGNTTCYLASKLSNLKKLYAIDPWCQYKDGVGKLGGFTERIAQENYEITIKNINKLSDIDKSKIEIVKRTSLESFTFFPERSIDFIYIDADHSYHSVLLDLESWYPKIKKNGLIFGHDINVTSVRMAIIDFLSDQKIDFNKLHILKNYAWVFRKEEYKC